MALTPPPERRAPERVLIYGVGGTGKSTAVVDLAASVKGKVWVVDTERAFDRMTEGRETELGNLDIFDVRFTAMVEDQTNWETMLAKVREIVKTMGRDDWLVIDSITPTWDDVQAWFTEKLWGDDLADYMMAARMQAEERGKKGGSAFEGFTDWPVINKQYNQLYNLILNAPGHVLLTAETAALVDEDKDTVVVFGSHGVKPKGQKRLPHIPHTVLLFRRRNGGRWVIDTVKDRNRDQLDGADNTGFHRTYLQQVAGWKQEAAWRNAAKTDGDEATGA